ncbi:hypothetical protein PHMEG_00030623 [Phytophthora megakarya]|uniref:Reverse transcriptase RNase H-like domain-containing protein n=1 Tax=Phytophthora megakarya TaxID=4795 RepID=A0A225V0M2_9STRA|nr:hypothetical protein PHMEG_00030623 [Phytophthora megakarya]
MLAYPDPSKQAVQLSDASERGFGLDVSQVSDWKPNVPIHEQNHDLNWSVIKKDSFLIVHACEELECLLLRPQGFRVYCDHCNIIHLFCPNKEIKRHVRGKLLRWSTKILEYRYFIENIEGVHNLWSNFIWGWGGKPLSAARVHSIKRIAR